MTGVREAVAVLTAGHTWRPPAAIAPRGTLLVLPGRGEHGGVYERFGRRLAADGYVVHAVGTAPHDGAAAVAKELTAAAGPEPAAPVVVVGADTGALQALLVAEASRDDARDTLGDPTASGEGLRVDAVVVAGIAPTAPRVRQPDPVRPDPLDPAAGWDGELTARTACPAHRQRLTADPWFARGALSRPVPAGLLPAAAPAVPVLLLHGDADPVTPIAEARQLAGRLPRAELGTVHGGLHDVLNDLTHRSVAAAVTQWLERLRGGPGSEPVITLETFTERSAR